MTISSQVTPTPPPELEAASNSARMMQFITGSFVSQTVRAFAELTIPDILGQHPATAREVAAAAGSHLEATMRLLRVGVALGLVTVDDQARFVSTSLLHSLRQDVPGSLRGLAIALASPGTWLPWGNLVAAVRSGERQTLPVHGMDYFEYLIRHPAEATIFTTAMDGVTGILAEQIAKIINTQSLSIAADIGGASGTLLHAFLAANSQLRGIVYDQVHVIPSATATAERLGLAHRISTVAGDFFEAVPEADLYLLKWILHDWDDAASVRILKNCRRALHPEGRVVIIELQLGPMNDPGITSLMDLNMMVMLTGRERTVEEYEQLLSAAELRTARVSVLQTPFGRWNVIEATVSASMSDAR